MRELSVRRKLNAMPAVFAGKRVLLVDDSIVRGTTMSQIVDMVRRAGASKVRPKPWAGPMLDGILAPVGHWPALPWAGSRLTLKHLSCRQTPVRLPGCAQGCAPAPVWAWQAPATDVPRVWRGVLVDLRRLTMQSTSH